MREEGKGDSDGAPAFDADATQVSTARALEATPKRLATLVVVQGSEIGRAYPLRRSRVVIGRGDNADVHLLDKEISRAHAAIEGVRLGSETLYRLSDLGSTNHLYVNGYRVDAHLLADGDKVQLGSQVLKFELHDAIDARFHDEIRNRIRYDDLTGLLTYESFRTALEWELAKYASSAKGCAVAMMDLDDFKSVNDRYGHLAGSHVLREIGALIRDNIRQFDVASRYGGEEFVAYLPETALAEAVVAVERVRAVLDQRLIEHQGREIHITMSIGLSHFPDDGGELVALIGCADRRLYGAKAAGKNRVVADP